MNPLEKRLTNIIAPVFKEATPGLVFEVHHKGKLKAHVELGKTSAYYDWASLTKIVFSASAWMFALDEKKFKLDDSVSKFLPWFYSGAPKKFWRIQDLMTHSAGLEWWKPYYSMIKAPGKNPELNWKALKEILRTEMENQSSGRVHEVKTKEGTLLKLDPKKQPKSVYSDLDLLILGAALEEVHQKPFHEIASEVLDRLGLIESGFHFANQPAGPRELYAPTEAKAFYGETRAGEVNDENTWALGGVAPHAGLFGPIDDLSDYGLLLRGSYFDDLSKTDSKRFASPKTTRKFLKRSVPVEIGDWGLLFMMPNKEGASCGPEFSSSSVGHLGFTGTSLWFDPKKDLLVTVLSNRVHPTRDNINIRLLRPLLHTAVVEELGL